MFDFIYSPYVKKFLILRLINRLYYRPPMQIEKALPEDKRVMPETRFIEFPALSVDARVGESLPVSKTNN